VPTGFTTFSVNVGDILNLATNFTVPDGATFTNTGNMEMNNNNLLMGTGSTFNSNSNLSTTGNIQRATPTGGAYDFAVENGSTLTVNDPITGNNTMSVAGGSTVVLSNGGSLNGISLNDGTFTINGGTFTGDITSLGGATALNINNAFTAPGAVNVNTLNVRSGAIFTPNATVTTNTALHIFDGGTLLSTYDIAGAGLVTNEGTITQTAGVRNIPGAFTQAATGTINIAVTSTSPPVCSSFAVTGQTTLQGGEINIALPSATTAINQGDVLTVLTSGGIAANPVLPTVVPTGSLFLSLRRG
jgi:hypothetical protein